ncbi:MAG: KH domain-containing protein [Anaerolineae bacterium]|nr:MAG: KH domain-containing protein [Anaerolineae bacterium]
MKALIEYIARSLVEHPEQVEVRTRRAGRRVVVELRVAKPDMGRVVGRHGRVANAMRALLRVAAERENKLASLDIIEP